MYIKRYALLLVVVISAGIFIYTQLQASILMDDGPYIRIDAAVPAYSSLQHSIHAIHKKHNHRNSEQVKQGISLVTEELKKSLPEVSIITTNETIQICIPELMQMRHLSAEIDGLSNALILKTRK